MNRIYNRLRVKYKGVLRLSLVRLLPIFFVCFFTATFALAQDQQEKNSKVFDLVKHYFDQKRADSLYALTGSEFRTNVPQSTFNDFAKQVFQLGPITSSSFIDHKEGVSSYKLAFTGATMHLSLSLDSSGKLKRFLVKPYKDPVADKTFVVSSSNLLYTSVERKIDTLARIYIQKENTVGLSIGILMGGVMSTYAYGTTEKGKDKLPDENTLFEIGSVSKTFTALLLAYYVSEGKLFLSDPVVKYLPDSVAVNAQLSNIKLLDLSNHTSGLSRMPANFMMEGKDPLNPYKDYNTSMMFSYLKGCKLSSIPGKSYAYSNLGAALLGVVLEKVTRKTYEQMVKEVICQPLKMNNTTQHLSEQQSKQFVRVYNEKGVETSAWDFMAMAPAGALRSSVHDLLLYAEANLKKDNVSLIKAMHKTQEITYDEGTIIGLGWHARKVRDKYVYFHDGGTYGSSTLVAFIPDKGIAVVVLSNATESVGETGMKLLDFVDGL